MTTSFPPLQLDSFDIIPVRLDFKLAVAHNLAKRHFTDNIVVRATASDGTTGYGECVPRSYITGETPESVLASLETACPPLVGRTFASPDDLVGFLREYELVTEHGPQPAARCSLELALLDLAGNVWNRSVSDMIGLDTTSEPLVYSMVIPFLPDRALPPFLDMIASYEFSRIKIKVDNNDPAKRVRMIRDRLGDTVELRIDANCAWTRETAPGHMHAFADLGVVSVEQPLAADDLEGMAHLRGSGLPLITLDESVFSASDIERIAAIQAADVLNIRISKCGGLIPSMHMIDIAASHGIGVQLGAQVGESCILSAAGAQLAAGTPSFKWLEGCFGTHLLTQGLCENGLRFGARGLVTPPDGSGLGIALDSGHLEKAATAYQSSADPQPDTTGPCVARNWGKQ